jgi:hypothetical protein
MKGYLTCPTNRTLLDVRLPDMPHKQDVAGCKCIAKEKDYNNSKLNLIRLL